MKLTAKDLARIREHLDSHLTDGHWHDGCVYCERRRRIGGDGLSGSQVPSLLSDLEEARRERDEAVSRRAQLSVWLSDVEQRAETAERECDEARATIQALEREYNHAQEANKALGDSRFQALKDLEEARAENAKLREFRKVIYEHLDKALTAMDRWPRASAPREKWLIRWTYLLQAVSAGPRIEDVLDNVAATEQEGKA